MTRPTEADLDKDLEVAEEMHRMAVEATHVPDESMVATSVAAVSASRAREIRRLRAIIDRVYESCTAHDPELDAEVLEIRQERRGAAMAGREADRVLAVIPAERSAVGGDLEARATPGGIIVVTSRPAGKP